MSLWVDEQTTGAIFLEYGEKVAGGGRGRRRGGQAAFMHILLHASPGHDWAG